LKIAGAVQKLHLGKSTPLSSFKRYLQWYVIEVVCLGSTGKRVPQCNDHHSVVQQIAFARRMADFFCLSKRSIKKKTPDDTGPAGSPVLLASGGTPKTR
jgi:hypothetical protein